MDRFIVYAAPATKCDWTDLKSNMDRFIEYNYT